MLGQLAAPHQPSPLLLVGSPAACLPGSHPRQLHVAAASGQLQATAAAGRCAPHLSSSRASISLAVLESRTDRLPAACSMFWAIIWRVRRSVAVTSSEANSASCSFWMRCCRSP